jgi:hypothetical protein
MLTDIARIKSSLDKYIVRPANFFGLGGFVFDVEGDAVVTLQNEITDHYAEDNSVVQDNIAVLPKRVVLRSFVGELADIVNTSDSRAVQSVVRKLTVLSGLLPDIAAGAEQVQDAIKQNNGDEGIDVGKIGDLSLENVLDIYSVVKNFAPPTTKQEQAYQYFKALREQKILMSIQTPFEFMTNMTIESIVARQGEDTRFVSDFTVTFKEIRFASTQTTELSADGRAAQQIELPDEVGDVAGVDKSILNEGLDNILGIDTAAEFKEIEAGKRQEFDDLTGGFGDNDNLDPLPGGFDF